MKYLFVFLSISLSYQVEASNLKGAGVEPVNKSSSATTNGTVPKREPLPEYFKPGVKHPLGVRPDCSEKKVSINELESLAKSGKITNTVDFLKSLPADSFQTFTLVTNSKSLQRCEGEGQVSDQWPRVIRSSVDGKISMSYTCNPKSCAYNKVEVMYYDDNGNEMNTMSIDLAQKPAHRTQKNEAKCLSCHGTPRPDGKKVFKPIWPEYPQWGGCKENQGISMYGANDDTMNSKNFRGGGVSDEYAGCSEKDLRESQIAEIENFKKFKANNLGEGEKNNPCYSTLPWAKPAGPAETSAEKIKKTSQFDPAKFESYPYMTNRIDAESESNMDGKENTYLRTNLRFGANYSRLNAKRIANEVAKSPNFEKIKYFLAMEAAGCLSAADEKPINKLIPGLNYTFGSRGSGQYNDPTRSNRLLYGYGKLIGIKDADWNLSFQDNKPTYLSAISRWGIRDGGEYDTGMPEVAAGEITTIVAKSDPKVGEKMVDGISRGNSEAGGAQWSCLDDIAGPVRQQFQGAKKPLCVALRASTNAFLKTMPETCDDVVEPKADDLAKNIEKVQTKMTGDAVKDGEKLVQDRCMSCHEADSDNPSKLGSIAFFENPKKPVSTATKEKLKKAFLEKMVPNIQARMKNGSMPAEGEALSDDEQNAVMKYVESISKK